MALLLQQKAAKMLDTSSGRLLASPAALLPSPLSGCTGFIAPRGFPFAGKAETGQFCLQPKARAYREAQAGLTPTRGLRHQEGIGLCRKAQQSPRHTNEGSVLPQGAI